MRWFYIPDCKYCKCIPKFYHSKCIAKILDLIFGTSLSYFKWSNLLHICIYMPILTYIYKFIKCSMFWWKVSCGAVNSKKTTHVKFCHAIHLKDYINFEVRMTFSLAFFNFSSLFDYIPPKLIKQQLEVEFGCLLLFWDKIIITYCCFRNKHKRK